MKIIDDVRSCDVSNNNYGNWLLVIQVPILLVLAEQTDTHKFLNRLNLCVS